MKNKTASFLHTRLARVIIISILGVSTAFGCAWSMLTEHSVRFNSMRTGRGFYRLPPLPVEYEPATGKERSTIEIEQYVDENPELEASAEQEAVPPSDFWKDAVSALENKDIPRAVAKFEEFLDASQYKPYWDESDERRVTLSHPEMPQLTFLTQLRKESTERLATRCWLMRLLA